MSKPVASLENLPPTIKNYILAQENPEVDDYEPMPNSYSITGLVGCIRKTHFAMQRRKQGLPKKPCNLKTANNFHRGKLWDKDFTSQYRHNQVRVTYRCKSCPRCVSGKFDFLNQDGPEPRIVDLKVPETLYYVEKEGKPSSHYVKQVTFYCYNTAIPDGDVMYWNGSKALVFPVDANEENCQKLIDEIEKKAYALYQSEQTGKPPSFQVANPEEWECRYCEYVQECNAEANP
jgi:hypothetical protein